MTYDPLQHIDEALLGRFVLNDATIGKQREDIEFHLRTCEGCSERFEEIKEYYGEVQALVHTHEQALVTTERILPGAVRGPKRDSAFVSVPRWNPVARFLVRYPFAASVGVVGLFAAALFLLLRPSYTETNPAYVKAREGFLIAFNKAGGELFRKQLFPEFDFQAIQLVAGIIGYSQEHYFTVADVDGDGTNEILLQLGWLSRPEKNTILCYNADGSERWRFQYRRTIKMQSESVTDDFVCQYFSVKDFDGDGKPDIVALFRHSTYSPSAIIRLDAANGTLHGEYWHAGWLYQIGEFPSQDGAITKIIAGGTNNGFRLADLLVLDPRHMSGQSPASEGYTIAAVGKGSQEQYITFPRNGPEHLMTQLYNRTSILSVAHDLIMVFVSEEFEGKDHTVATVQFDRGMNITAVTEHDDFRSYISALRRNGKSSVKDPAAYSSGFRSGIRYWNGEIFVPESKTQTRPTLLP